MAENPAPRVAIPKRKVTAARNKQNDDTDSRTYACQVCSRTFGSSKALRSHCFATKHQVRCSVCNKGFLNDEGLRHHTHIHEIDALLDKSEVSRTQHVLTVQGVNEKVVELEEPTTSLESTIVRGTFNNFSVFFIY